MFCGIQLALLAVRPPRGRDPGSLFPLSHGIACILISNSRSGVYPCQLLYYCGSFSYSSSGGFCRPYRREGQPSVAAPSRRSACLCHACLASRTFRIHLSENSGEVPLHRIRSSPLCVLACSSAGSESLRSVLAFVSNIASRSRHTVILTSI
ncbi:hypothetical protein B0H21DRAFT_113801 [Amylocystis lapponica]|nr:hypothetical protein B0H21DRAFT_113801 [Amylocystis lapponica]